MFRSTDRFCLTETVLYSTNRFCLATENTMLSLLHRSKMSVDTQIYQSELFQRSSVFRSTDRFCLTETVLYSTNRFCLATENTMLSLLHRSKMSVDTQIYKSELLHRSSVFRSTDRFCLMSENTMRVVVPTEFRVSLHREFWFATENTMPILAPSEQNVCRYTNIPI